MKKLFTLLLICLAIFGIYKGGKLIYHNYQENQRVKEAKKGWHVEILNDYINVRELPDQFSKSTGTVKKGEIYKVIEINLDDPNHYWYKVELKDSKKGWIANNTSGTYLKDVDDPTDVAIPIIKFEEDEYHVISIDDITYDHLNVWDDKDDYEITHIVYHEVDTVKNIDQYWIKYTITDASGKYSSKTQKIVFEKEPDPSQVQDFAEFNRD